MPKRKLTIGILAHVDAGKTTLCEGLLFASGAIRSRGRVDHGDAYLDNFELEKQRGITIFAKQARFSTEAIEVNLIDTPGHVDFSTEAERILAVLDYAVLVISGSEGVQAHTETLWKLLRSYNVPTFIFINKMDLPAADKGLVMAALNKRISESCVDFSKAGAAEFYEEVAMTDEELLDDFVEDGNI
nr:GTP-binding protein [Eubacteriales bacterium]